MLFDLILHLWNKHNDFKPALHLTVDVATDMVMRLSKIRRTPDSAGIDLGKITKSTVLRGA